MKKSKTERPGMYDLGKNMGTGMKAKKGSIRDDRKKDRKKDSPMKGRRAMSY